MKTLLKSFYFAVQGIAAAFQSERNFRIHVTAAIIVIAAGLFFNISLIEWIVILLLIGGMLALELVNTAIERIADAVSKEFHPLLKTAKDAAAGAVLVYAAVSVVIGFIIFAPKIIEVFS
ncbi:MAG: diacylglycerol kinase family protein [Bacillaceae bacterium]|jgi:Diacylglycerol kinase|uniref:Undecaprenol kinase n=1 Tax=Aeribacillus pallidus TaxID=33936 RepID=A0A165XQ53_9BACI|nr:MULTISPECIES: diacylglycerol kinase family protein [Aeribacillus]REJ21461.1 MAG: diacylglycerol kinase family protein [Bacillaceae bacterium]KZN96284.1 hypothetical protein AZI98_09515 [Aeribacillus pallidus]MDR9795795.1 diacylglycerol kinase family protein [Aeribacillus pallidus]MED1438719.1 diacylglycerol kinase family protein [Aeribacillus composti]MED1442204.1 diacylglycerol kinase family protein [Aeribacillus composti]